MKDKPPTRRAVRLKCLIAAGAVSLGVTGAGLAAAGPASADPSASYAAVGSDTIQDIMNAYAHVATPGELASYNAVNPVTANPHELITPAVTDTSAAIGQDNCSFTRPNGSGEGFKALDASVNPTTTLGQDAVPPQPGCITISRSSSGPGSIGTTGPGSLDPSGNLVYIPLALDAVTDATGPTTAGQTTTTQCVSTTSGCGADGTITFTIPATSITNADMFTLTDLQTLFGQGEPVTEGGVTYWPQDGSVPQPAGSTVIDLYVPQAGSGTLQFWGTVTGFNSTAPPAWDHQTILTGPAAGVQVEEHDGTAFASDPNGLGPLSIAQYIAQTNGFNDRRHGDVIHDVNGVAPETGTALNENFPIVREVYNVTQYDKVVNTGDGNFDPNLAALLVGPTSTLCQSTFTIRQYGFGTLPSPNTPDACGATSNSLRVQETNDGPS